MTSEDVFLPRNPKQTKSSSVVIVCKFAYESLIKVNLWGKKKRARRPLDICVKFTVLYTSEYRSIWTVCSNGHNVNESF